MIFFHETGIKEKQNFRVNFCNARWERVNKVLNLKILPNTRLLLIFQSILSPLDWTNKIQWNIHLLSSDIDYNNSLCLSGLILSFILKLSNAILFPFVFWLVHHGLFCPFSTLFLLYPILPLSFVKLLLLVHIERT